MDQTPTKSKRASTFIRAIRAFQAEFNAPDSDIAPSAKPQRNTWNGPAYEYSYTSQATVTASTPFVSSFALNDDSLTPKRHTVQARVTASTSFIPFSASNDDSLSSKRHTVQARMVASTPYVPPFASNDNSQPSERHTVQARVGTTTPFVPSIASSNNSLASNRHTIQAGMESSTPFVAPFALNDDLLPSKRHTAQGDTFESARGKQQWKFTPDDYTRKYQRSVTLTKQILEEMFFGDEIWTEQQPLPTERFICTITAVPDYRDQVNQDVLCIKEAVLVMPLRDFLSWLPVTYDLHRLTRQGFLPRHITKNGQITMPKNCYHELIALEAQYNLDISAIHDNSIHQIICSIRSTLKWLRVSIDVELSLIEEQHRKMKLREFLAWCYNRYRIQRKTFFHSSEPWNPQCITSTTRVRKEAITYYERLTFITDKTALSIHAKHIVCLLRGAGDWRKTAGDVLIFQHPSPSQLK